MKCFFEEEQIERMFLEMHKGNYKYFFLIVENFLDTLMEELASFDNFDDLAPIGLFALFCAIKSYNREKQSNACTYIRKYIHLSLLIHQENKTKLDTSSIEVCFPSYGITITNDQFNQYLEEMREKYILISTPIKIKKDTF